MTFRSSSQSSRCKDTTLRSANCSTTRPELSTNHYLGDPIEATSRQPKALDEVMALYASKQWVNEPGKKWDWSISGFQLLVTILERVSGQSYQEYVSQNIFAPTGARATTYCDDFTLTRGLSHGYRRLGHTQATAHETRMPYTPAYPSSTSVAPSYQSD